MPPDASHTQTPLDQEKDQGIISELILSEQAKNIQHKARLRIAQLPETSFLVNTTTTTNPTWRDSKWSALVVASLAVFVDLILYGIIFPIQLRLLLESGVPQGDLDYWQGALQLSNCLGFFVTTPIFGWITDKLRDRKGPMLCGLFALAGSTLGMAYVRNAPWLCFFRMLQGVSAASTWVVGFAMVNDAFPANDGLGLAVGIIFGAHTMGSLVGPVIGGFIGEYFGLKWPFLLCFGLIAVDFIGRVMIRPPAPPPNDGEGAGFLPILSHGEILLGLGALFVCGFGIVSIIPFIPAWLEQEWGFSESKASLFMLVLSSPNLFMTTFVGWLSDRVSRVGIATVGMLMLSVWTPAISFSRDVPMLIATLLLAGMSYSVLNAPVLPYMSAVLERKGVVASGKLYSLVNMTFSAGMMIGPIVVAIIKSRFSFHWALLTLGVLNLIYAPIFYFMANKLEARQATESEESSPLDHFIHVRGFLDAANRSSLLLI